MRDKDGSPGLTPRGLAQCRRHSRLSWVPGDPSGHENWIVKNVSLETIHCIPRKTAPNPSPSPPCTIHSLNSGWELGSHSAHLLSISLVAFSQFHISKGKKKKNLENHKQKEVGEGQRGPAAAGMPVGGRGLQGASQAGGQLLLHHSLPSAGSN